MGKTIQVFGFPYLVSAEVVKAFLERHTRDGSVYALAVKQAKGGRRAFSIVQFCDNRSAEIIINLASAGLYFGNSYLKAWEMKTDMVQPRAYVNHMDDITLNFGCQISKNKFSVFWETTDVEIKFGFGLKKIYLFLSYSSAHYKLQLSYENVWEIVLHRPSGQTTKFLVIQLFAAPRIYKRLEESSYSFYKETPDEQWVRTTDFTPSSIVGQSSSLCLKFRHGTRLPNFREDFFYYTESEDPFTLQHGFPSYLPQDLSLVPIVHPPKGVELPYKILFKISLMVQHGCLPGPALNILFFRLVNPRMRDISFIEHALERLYYLKECCYDPVKWLSEQYDQYRQCRQFPKSPFITLDDGLVYVRRVLVTPCKVYFYGPEVNVSNRVLRHYSEYIDNFLRVSFVDEEWEKIHSVDLLPRSGIRTKIYERILSTLQNGIVIGDKNFEFLAFSSSQLRDNSVWMFASAPGLTANDIRAWMGDFRQIRNVAKYAARLGQSFGSSRETLSVGRREFEVIPDVQVHGTNYVFSDGIGKISADFAGEVAGKCGLKHTPSSFQIRYGGFKGVVAVDPYSSMKLSLRRSMLKYKSDNTKLDVLGWSKYQPCYLNRQLVTLLSTLGVRDEVFERKQNEAVAQLDAILHDSSKAQEALELMSPGENTHILKTMLNVGYMPDAEPFLQMMLQTFRASKLLDLRTRTRIFIPDGRTMMGCLDESRTLEYGQVFVQFSGAGRRYFYDDESGAFNDSAAANCNYILKGNVTVAKNPCLHPGDIRILTAVDIPVLHHMVDCVVFPQKGNRPHPNECSGSDLDGDVYFVCWDQDLIPRIQVQPMDYTPEPTTQLDHDVTIEEVEEYFTNYIVNDSLGILANAHVVFADREPEMAMSAPCKQLAQLFSIAVDFPKTGVPAEIPFQLRPKEYPDFMEKPDKTTYHSEKVIGKLFRKVKEKTPEASSIATFTREVARRSYDSDLEVDGFEDYIEEAIEYKGEYDNKLGNLMDLYGIKTEAEVLSGGVMKASKTYDRRRDADAISVAVKSLRKEARTWFKRRSDMDDMLAKASAWYHVTYHPTYWGCYSEGLKRDHFISFPWCVYHQLVEIKRKKARSSHTLRVSSLTSQFYHKLVV